MRSWAPQYSSVNDSVWSIHTAAAPTPYPNSPRRIQRLFAMEIPMTHQDWLTLFAPAMGALVFTAAGLMCAVLSGLTAKAGAYLTAHKMAAEAAAVADANTVIQSALTTEASTLAGKIASGKLDYTDRAAWEAQARQGVSLVEQRVPGAIRTAQPVAGALIASLMAKVDQQMVASPTPLAGQVAPDAGTAITAAAATLNNARAALDSVAAPVVPKVTAPTPVSLAGAPA